jgi:hypothetical protein
LKVLATYRYPGPAFDELEDVEVRALAELDSARPEVEALIVANEPVPLSCRGYVSSRTTVSVTTGSALRS